MSKHKILFLDIDGVLNPQWWERKKPSDKYGVPFDPKTVACLEKIIAETGANIVISSSWKNMGLSVVQDMWRERGLPGKVIDITPDYLSESLLCSELNNDYVLYERGCEIKGWLFLHKDKISHYVIVDDMVDTAGTITKAANIMMEAGARTVRACASHCVMSGPASERVQESALEEIVFTDSIPYANRCAKVKQLSVADMFAETIRRVINNESISNQYLI